ncbi:MAG TPA: DeoR/GlpR family DNA-binding transcription regulator [Gaiellaceae bacterium]|nr:DeoR/GlpR family DNA-binding transcription regulator [Gaiellaceae bacterium]
MRTLADERRAEILRRLDEEGRVFAADLVRDLTVSRDTIRRDLEELAGAGLLVRVHGGALPRVVGGQPYHIRRRQAPEAKEAIAKKVVELIRPGAVVFLDAGTTAQAVARALPPDLEVTVATNSPPAAVVLADHPRAEVFLLGGRLVKNAVATAGAATLEMIAEINADVCVLGVCSVHPEFGISVMDLEEAHIKRAMIRRSAEVIAVTAADKLGTQGPYVVGPIDELTAIVTDATSAIVEPYRAAGVAVVSV